MCVVDFCALVWWTNLYVPSNDHMNPIWIDTVSFGMLPILEEAILSPPQYLLHSPNLLLSLNTCNIHPSQNFKERLHGGAVLEVGRRGCNPDFLFLSPSVWDIQTHFEPQYFSCLPLFSFNLQPQFTYSILHLYPVPPNPTFPKPENLPLSFSHSLSARPSVSLCLIAWNCATWCFVL